MWVTKKERRKNTRLTRDWNLCWNSLCTRNSATLVSRRARKSHPSIREIRSREQSALGFSCLVSPGCGESGDAAIWEREFGYTREFQYFYRIRDQYRDNNRDSEDSGRNPLRRIRRISTTRESLSRPSNPDIRYFNDSHIGTVAKRKSRM